MPKPMTIQEAARKGGKAKGPAKARPPEFYTVTLPEARRKAKEAREQIEKLAQRALKKIAQAKRKK